MTRIETARTTMRPFEEADVEAAFGWFGNPDVTRYTRGPDPSLSETRRRISAYSEQQARLGFSKWIVLDRATGERIGDAGLLVLAEVGPLPDLGYRPDPVAVGTRAGLRDRRRVGVGSVPGTRVERCERICRGRALALTACAAEGRLQRTGRRVVMGSDAAVFELLRSDFTRSEVAPT